MLGIMWEDQTRKRKSGGDKVGGPKEKKEKYRG